MTNFYKKIFNVFLLVIFLAGIILYTNYKDNHVSALENINLKSAENAMNNFLISSIKTGDYEWYGFKIIDFENIYDSDLNHYGYVFDLSNGDNLGYGIVVKNNDNFYMVAEASSEVSSPYSRNGENYNIYLNSLNYFGVSKIFGKNAQNAKYIDLNNQMIFSKSEIEMQKFSYEIEKTLPFHTNGIKRAPTGEKTVYIKDHNRQFERMQQPNDTSCVPTSFAMSIKYLHNIGALTLDTYYRDINNLEKRLRLLADCKEKKCLASKMVTAIRTFSDANIKGAKIRTRDDEFQPDTYLSVAQDEVDANCPPIVIFYSKGLIPTITAEHATTMIGYKIINNQTTNGETIKTNYIIVMDPFNGCTKRTVA